MQKGTFILFILTVDMLLLSSSNTLVMPFLPVYLKNELNCQESSLSLYTALCYSITFVISAIVSPIWGKAADNSGKKAMLIRVSFILSLSYLFSFLASTPLELCLSRAFQGFASGMSPALLAIASVSAKKMHTGLFMGAIQSSNLIGTITGPFLGGLIAQFYGVKECFLLVFSVSIIVLLLNVIFIKEPQGDEDGNESDEQIGFIELLKDPVMKSLTMCILINALVIMMIVPLMTDYLSGMVEGKEIAVSGMVFAISGLAGAIAAPIWGHLGQLYGFLKILITGALGCGVFYIAQGLVDSIAIFCIIQFFSGFFISSIAPTVHSITAKHIENKHCTKAYSLVYSSQQLGNLLGPVIGCLLVKNYLNNNVFLVSGTIFAVESLILVSIYLKRKKNS